MAERHAFNQEKEKKITADIIFKVEAIIKKNN